MDEMCGVGVARARARLSTSFSVIPLECIGWIIMIRFVRKPVFQAESTYGWMHPFGRVVRRPCRVTGLTRGNGWRVQIGVVVRHVSK